MLPPPLGQATLPSVVAAERFFTGSDKGKHIIEVLGSALGRATLIGAGMYVAGERQNVVRNAVAGALAIEVFVLAYVGWQVAHEGAAGLGENPCRTR